MRPGYLPRMKPHVELHGHESCPFAWRTRLAAAEKEISFDWIPCDVERPDPRAVSHNSGEQSPLLIHDWLTLTESMVICQYLDDAFPGRTLEPEDPARRAIERLAMREIDFEFADGEPDEETPERAEVAFEALETRLRETPWLGGEKPSLLDLSITPFLASTILRIEQQIPARHPHCEVYWKRVQRLPAYERTRPSWAAHASR
jgi:glutathione S-transferase